MRSIDAFGYETTFDSPEHAEQTLTSWNATARAFLSHAANTPVHLSDTLKLTPDFALAQLAKGYFMLLLGRRELIPAAQEAYDAVTPLVPALTPREKAYHDGLGLYLAGRMGPAADVLDAALRAHPHDALLAKLVHEIRFILGDPRGMRSSLEAIIGAYGPDHPSAGYINGCYAFALEETGEYLAAERRGRDALVIAHDDAWGLHAVAHVYDMTGRSAEGVAWISRQPKAWEHCNNFGYHVWWHLALFHLDRGEYDRVLELYDAEIRKEQSDDYRDISNAASLLSRLELEGVDVGERWEEMAALSENRAEDGCVVFADLHYLLALEGGGRPEAVSRLLGEMRNRAQRQLGCMDSVAGEAGLPAAQGLHAFASGDYAEAYGWLARARPHMQVVGGSHAQRDVFDRITIEAALRSGLLREARAQIEDRVHRRGAMDRYAETRLARIDELGRQRASGAQKLAAAG
ncbi:MAG: tetratricopeptide repeat protein [Pseudomonadota bacterium]